mgnify:CR=1 FL=1
MKRIVILGAGESGAGAAVLAKKEGFDVFVSDMSIINEKYKKMLDDHQIEWEEGHHTEEKILVSRCIRCSEQFAELWTKILMLRQFIPFI